MNKMCIAGMMTVVFAIGLLIFFSGRNLFYDIQIPVAAFPPIIILLLVGGAMGMIGASKTSKKGHSS